MSAARQSINNELTEENSGYLLRERVLGSINLEPGARRSLRDTLMLQLYSASPTTRSICAIGLGRIGDERAIPLLLWASFDPEPLVCWHAVQALRSLSDRSLIPPGTIIFEDGPRYSRWKANLIKEIDQALSDKAVSTRLEAVAALAEIGDPFCLDFLFNALRDEQAQVRWEVGLAIKSIVAKSTGTWLTTRDYLAGQLAESDRIARTSAIDTFGQIGNAASIPLLLLLLHDADARVRWSVCEALGKIGVAAVAYNVALLLVDDDPWVRSAAAKAVAAMNGRSALPALIRVAKDEDVFARRAIIKAIGAIGDETALPTLADALYDADDDVVFAAIAGLQQKGSRASLSHLRRLRRGRFAHAVRAAIHQIESATVQASQKETYRMAKNISQP